MSGGTLRKVLAVTALLVACSSDTSGPPATVASVVVSSPGSSVPITGTLQLSAVPRDAGGNPLNGRSVTWASGDTAIARVSSAGLVTGRSLGTATITATVEGVPGSVVITVVTGPPARLSFIVQPSSTTSGTTLSPAVQVEVQDAAGNRVTGASNSITLTLGANPKNGSLGGATVQAATNGVATFSNLTIDSAATGYTLAAAATGLTGATSGAFNITVGAPARLGFQVQPANTTGGATISPAVQVEIRDAGGNRVPTATNAVTLMLGTNPKSGTLGGTVSGAAVSGIASFNTLTIDSAGTGYTLIANATGLTAATSAAFSVAVGPAVSLAFLVQPTNTGAGAPITPAVQVEVRDAAGNRVTAASTSITLAIGTNPSGGSLSGTNPVTAVNGVATFSDLSIDKFGTGYTVAATAGGLTGATSAPFDIATGGAVRLAFFVQPSTTSAGTTMNPAVQVELQDAGGNRATGATNSVTIALGTNPKNGTLSGTKTIAAVNGVATFATLSVDSAGTGYTLTAAATGVTGTTSSAFNITVGAAAKLGFLVQPGSTTGGGTIAPAVQVEVRDAGGNRVTTATNSVTVAIGTNPNSGTLGGTKTVAAVNGVASFSTLSIDSAGIGYALSATATGLTAATSSAFSISVGPATRLGFLVQPTNAGSGALISPAVQVEVRDLGGNRVTTATTNITLAIGTNPSNGVLTGTNPKAAVAGVATFSDLSVDKNGTGYTLTAAGGGLTGATSAAFNIQVGGATKLAFVNQPGNATGGATIAPAVTVAVQDAGGNVVTSATNNVTLAIGTNPGSGALSGTKTVAAVNGIATFSTLSVDSAGTGYTLAAAATGLTGATSGTFNITVGPAAKLGFLVQPANASGGATITPTVQVEIRDAGGNRVTTATNSVTVAIGTNPNNGTLGGTKTVAASAGVASFATLTVDSAGTGYTLTANATGLTAATSAAFTVSVGPAVKLGFRVQPSNEASGTAIAPAVEVEVRDSGGNRVTTASTSITLALGANPKNGTLSGTTTRSAASGLATFNNLTIDSAATGYTLTAAATGLTGSTSTSFNITVGAAVKLGFLVQPANTTGGATISPAVQVEIRDAGGNRVTGATNNVTVALGANPKNGTLGGTKTVAASGGVASFSTLTVDSAAAGYTLAATATSLTGATSSSFNITVGPAAKLGFRVQPTNTASGAPITPAVAVEVQDLGGNRITSANTSITLAIGTNPSGGVLSGTNPKAAVNGVATFSDLSIDKNGTGYTLTATGGGLTGATSTPFNIAVGGATKLAFVSQPTTATGGATINPAVTVAVQDAGGNVVTGATNSITLAIGTNPNSGTLAGTKTVAAVNGVATFSTLNVDSAGTGYTLSAAATGLTGATSNAFNITVGAAAKLGFRVQPASTTGGATIAPAVQVEVRDAGGNRVTSASNNITVAIGTNPNSGTLGGTKTVAAASGLASFSTLTIDSAGTGYTLSASASGLTAATSSPFNITVGPAAKLGFLVQPSNTPSGASITPAVQVEVRDAGGNRVTSATTNITLAIGTNPSGGVLSGTNPKAAVSGVAVFSNLSIDKSGTGYTLTAAGATLTGATSAAFNITGGTADHLGFFVQPSNGTAGASLSPAVQVEVLDASGNRVTTDTRSITVAILDNPGGGTLSGTKTVAASAGVASFSGLSIDKAGTSYTLQATSSPALTSATSADFNIAPAAPSRAHFFVEPTSTTAGVSITPDMQVEILDAFGNRVGTATNSVTVALLANPGSGTLSGTKTRNASAGVATFPGLSINKAANGYTIRATSSGLASDTSVAFNITPGPASQLAFTTQPANTAAGATMANVVVTARDAQGNTATGFTGDVAMAIGTNPGSGTLSGTLSVPAVSGVATFSNLRIDKVGTGYTLTASATGPTSATSTTFNITVGAAAKLAFGQQPTSTTGGAAISPAVTVRILDANGNLTASTASVSLAITTGTGTAGAHLGGTVSKAAVAGVATFNDVSIDSAGTAYTLRATSSGLTADTSTAFNVAVGAGAKLDFLVQPSTTPPGGTITPAVQVEIRDAGGNLVTTDNTTSVTVAIGTNPSSGTLAGTKTQTASAGVATFSNLSINNAGNGYDLTASATSLTSATSNSFDIVVGTAAKLAFFVQPSNAAGGATISPAVQVEIQDAGGNRVTSATNSITLAFGANPKNGHLSGTKTVAAASGVAVFDNLSIDSAATGYTLSASSSGLTGATSNTFTITVGPADRLGFRVQPANTAGGATITPAVQVEVRDAGGNRVTTASNSITMAIGTNPTNGTLSGTTTLSASSGVATFSTLSIDSAGTGYRLSATATGLTGATSSTFNITVGAAAKLAFLVQPSDAAAGSPITPAVKVEILDAGGNLTTATNNVTVAIGTNPGGGALGGTKTVGAVSGVATFSNLSINKTGVGYTLQATSGTLTAATSTAFDIGADGVDGTASTLVAATDTIGQCLFSCAAGIRASTVTVTVRDGLGNLVSGAPVTLTASGTGNAFVPSATGNTDANGVFTAAFNSSDFGSRTVSASAGGVGIAQTAAVAVMPVLVGAGDIADCNSVRDDATANQLDSIAGTVFAAGDNAYPNGRAADFTNCYDPTWGRHKARTKPVVGNHEYDSSGTAAAYFSYFTPAVADPLGNGYGYYSFDLGTWHVVVLNSDSGVTSPVSGPAQLSWLQSDLAGRTNQCVLAIWHRPLFTSGGSGGAGIRVRRLWQALENAGAEIVLNGHDHLYERFAPQDSLGNANSAGIREFIVGTGGGETHSNYVNSPANVEASDAGNFSRGVLRLTLYASSYRWEFLPAQGQGTFTDSGTASCH
ncbi:MAG TPA: hypothetical protein VLB49_09255 [Gemmatimonadales bacterium]|nr:hypothetical protein [Gemmatimonadales bacterium]